MAIARQHVSDWRIHGNEERLHLALDVSDITPLEAA